MGAATESDFPHRIGASGRNQFFIGYTIEYSLGSRHFNTGSTVYTAAVSDWFATRSTGAFRAVKSVATRPGGLCEDEKAIKSE